MSSASDSEALPEPPPEPRILVKDTGGSSVQIPGDQPITDADRERAAAAFYVWQGQPLNPYSIARQGMFNITRGFLPLGILTLPDEYSPSYLLEACLLLFLCASEPVALRAIRHNADLVLDASQEWADANIPNGQQTAAGTLAFQILRDATLTIAVARPEGSSNRAEGNSPRP